MSGWDDQAADGYKAQKDFLYWAGGAVAGYQGLAYFTPGLGDEVAIAAARNLIIGAGAYLQAWEFTFRNLD